MSEIGISEIDISTFDVFKEHRDMVTRRVKPGANVIIGLTPKTANMLHMAVGIAGEAGEILENITAFAVEGLPWDRKNFLEECGDMEFFLEGARQEWNIPREHVIDALKRGDWGVPGLEKYLYSPLHIAVKLSVVASTLALDAGKRPSIYVKELDYKMMMTALCNIEILLMRLRDTLEVSREETLVHNIEKLDKRFGLGQAYSDAAAQARVDKDPVQLTASE